MTTQPLDGSPRARAGRPLVVLVHGTFAPDAPWTRLDAPLPKSLCQRVADVDIEAFQWSGRNTFEARIEAGEMIAGLLRSVSPDVPVALISHSHGGSAVCYAAKRHPEAFRNVRAVVCLATPFFGFSVRPGYQALLFGIVAALSFVLFQIALAALTIFGRSLSPRFDEQPLFIAAIGLGLVLSAVLGARRIWALRGGMYRSYSSTMALAESWDTTQVDLKNALFARSMGDEVGLGLGTLQFVSTVLNRVLNAVANTVSTALGMLGGLRKRRLGWLRLSALLLPFVVVSALPAAMAANFGYRPRFWIDILNPWSKTFGFFDPAFGPADHSARAIYAAVLLVVIASYLVTCLFALFMLLAVALGWITTGAFGCFSLRLALATQWAVEPTPEGQHAFLNGGWSRDPSKLKKDRVGLQHSEPYAAPGVVQSVVEFVEARLRGGARSVGGRTLPLSRS